MDGSRSQCESQHGTRGLTTNDGTDEIEEDDEPHREETESAHLGQEVQLSEVVDGGVDPSSTLAEGGKERSGRSENSVGASRARSKGLTRQEPTTDQVRQCRRGRRE